MISYQAIKPNLIIINEFDHLPEPLPEVQFRTLGEQKGRDVVLPNLRDNRILSSKVITIAINRELLFGLDVKLEFVFGICRRDHIFACPLFNVKTGILGDIASFLRYRLAFNKCLWFTRL